MSKRHIFSSSFPLWSLLTDTLASITRSKHKLKPVNNFKQVFYDRLWQHKRFSNKKLKCLTSFILWDLWHLVTTPSLNYNNEALYNWRYRVLPSSNWSCRRCWWRFTAARRISLNSKGITSECLSLSIPIFFFLSFLIIKLSYLLPWQVALGRPKNPHSHKSHFSPRVWFLHSQIPDSLHWRELDPNLLHSQGVQPLEVKL